MWKSPKEKPTKCGRYVGLFMGVANETMMVATVVWDEAVWDFDYIRNYNVDNDWFMAWAYMPKTKKEVDELIAKPHHTHGWQTVEAKRLPFGDGPVSYKRVNGSREEEVIEELNEQQKLAKKLLEVKHKQLMYCGMNITKATPDQLIRIHELRVYRKVLTKKLDRLIETRILKELGYSEENESD